MKTLAYCIILNFFLWAFVFFLYAYIKRPETREVFHIIFGTVSVVAVVTWAIMEIYK